MSSWFVCYSCNKALPIISSGDGKKCPGCGSPHGDVRSGEEIEQMREAGALRGLAPDARKGRPKKPKR